jgi:hypothetical protein
MQPASPVFPDAIPGFHPPEVVYAKDQPQYIPLPVVRDSFGIITARWHMTWTERLLALIWGDVYVKINTFNQPLQPIRLCIVPPEIQGAFSFDTCNMGSSLKQERP